MQFGEFFFDGDLRVIYEAPTVGFSYITNGDGYRIYAPNDIDVDGFSVVAGLIAKYDMRADIWSKYVEYMDAIEWAMKAFFKSGGASRGFDAEGGESFATADFRTINNWKFVPANYKHDFILMGNLQDESDNTILGMFDHSRLTWFVGLGVYAADAFMGYVISPQMTAAVNRMSFGDAVNVDEDHGYTVAEYDAMVAADYPNAIAGLLGNAEFPVKYFAEAIPIAENYHFHKIRFYRSCSVPAGVDVSEYLLEGNGGTLSMLSVHPDATCFGTWIKETYFTGSLDDNARLEMCYLDSVDYFNGMIFICIIKDTGVKLYGSSPSVLIDCKWDGMSPSLIDHNNSLSPTSILTFTGALLLKNLTEDVPITCNFEGMVIIDSSCTAGSITLSGNGEIINNSTGTCVVDDSRVVSGIHQRKIYNELINTAELNNDKTLAIITDENGVESHRHAITPDGLTRTPA